MHDFPEPDCKTLRAIQPSLLDRLCTRILEEVRGVIDDGSVTAHERYRKLFKLLERRDGDVAAGFNDMRRSQALLRIANLYALGLMTEEEFGRFSLPTRERVLFTVNRGN